MAKKRIKRPCDPVEDEIRSFVYAKAKNVPTAKKAPDVAGDIWTWTAIDAETKLIAFWLVGDRSGDTAKIFVDDLASRLENRVQITTDGHKAYLEAIEGAFGNAVDYAMLVKVYGPIPRRRSGTARPSATGHTKSALPASQTVSMSARHMPSGTIFRCVWA
jgi:hypothetical protein